MCLCVSMVLLMKILFSWIGECITMQKEEEKIPECVIPYCGEEESENANILVPLCMNGHFIHLSCFVNMYSHEVDTTKHQPTLCPICRCPTLVSLVRESEVIKDFKISKGKFIDWKYKPYWWNSFFVPLVYY